MQLRLSTLASALSLAFLVSQANAQTPGQAEPAKVLPAMDVTAERTGSFKSDVVQVGTFRDMAPLDVPQASNVVTREVLDAQAATTLFGALRNTAGVTRTALNGATYDNIAIRGILVDNRGNYRLNGSLPIINLIDVPLENKERDEVLKGASSLYYGFVPPSGIVNLVTKRAGKEPVTTLTLSANQHGGANVHADAAAGLALQLLALVLTLRAQGPSFGSLLWAVMISAAAMAVAFTLAWQPRWLRPITFLIKKG